MILDLKQLRRDVDGFRGRFEFLPEDEHCPDRLVYISADPDQEGEYVISDCVEEHVAEPIARMLNAVGPLLAEIDQLRRDGEVRR